MLIVKIWIFLALINIIYTFLMRNYYKNDERAALKARIKMMIGKTHWPSFISALLNFISVLGLLYCGFYFLFIK